jgi:hypothetical protein
MLLHIHVAAKLHSFLNFGGAAMGGDLCVPSKMSKKSQAGCDTANVVKTIVKLTACYDPKAIFLLYIPSAQWQRCRWQEYAAPAATEPMELHF